MDDILKEAGATEEKGHDVGAIKEFIEKLFRSESEIKLLREDIKDLKTEYKKKVDLKLVSNIIRLVKAKLKLTASESTIEEIEGIIVAKINIIE